MTVAMVVLLFGLCSLPSVLTRVLVHAFWEFESCSVQLTIVEASGFTGSLSCLHNAPTPAICCFSNPAFTHSYRKVLRSLGGRRKAAEPASSNFLFLMSIEILCSLLFESRRESK